MKVLSNTSASKFSENKRSQKVESGSKSFNIYKINKIYITVKRLSRSSSNLEIPIQSIKIIKNANKFFSRINDSSFCF
jgi:hypothetical protein